MLVFWCEILKGGEERAFMGGLGPSVLAPLPWLEVEGGWLTSYPGHHG